LLCSSELQGRGATLILEPWDNIALGQRFWIDLIGRTGTGTEKETIRIYTAELLTPEEVNKGLTKKITQQQLEHFYPTPYFEIQVKVTLDGSEDEKDAAVSYCFFHLIHKFFEQTNFSSSSMNDWHIDPNLAPDELTRIEMESDYALHYDREKALLRQEKVLLYKDFSGLIPNQNYKLIICMRGSSAVYTIKVTTTESSTENGGVGVGSPWSAKEFRILINSASTRIKLVLMTAGTHNFYVDLDDIKLIMDALPVPTISHTQTNLLFLNTIGSEGITFSVAPWGSFPGQKVWLTAYHDQRRYDLLKAHPLTEDEARDGLSVVFHPEDLLSLSNHTPLTFTLDITEDESVAKNDATTFKVLAPKLITDFVSRTTFTANNWDQWVAESPGPGSSVDIINEDNHFFVRTIEASAHGDTPILSRTFTGLSTGYLYKLVVPMRRVDLKTNAPSFAIQLSTGEWKETFTLTNMEWTDFTYSLNVPQANIKFQIISLGTPHGGNVYDIDDICLIKVDPL
jgi:hypothetical protein